MFVDKEATIRKFNSFEEKFSNLGWISCDEADDTKEQYNEFGHKDCVKCFEKFEKFDNLCDRLGEFLRFYCNKPHFTSSWKFSKVVLVLSHGQAELECGFSVNLKGLHENMQELSLVL